ncbi:MAG: nucleotidyl transferase AbiEii/AbiGii toxin family protein [Anaerolineae bacterium]|nr:nucleotidyl transferase AbiEii/AbiGii toxin family protein [Anaerolineae bacterium]
MIADNPWLTPLQKAFLDRFFRLEVGRSFFLTGGTALAAFYLHHRLSVDLDLFTLDDVALTEGARLTPLIAQELGWEILLARHTDYFHRFSFQDRKGETLQVDLVQDFGPQFGQRQQFQNVVVDSMENIAANKLTAILGRSEAKDFVDLYFVLKGGVNFEAVMEMARQKDTGLVPFHLAGALLQVRHIHVLPETHPPTERETLVQFFMALADRLIDQSKPQVGEPWNF